VLFVVDPFRDWYAGGDAAALKASYHQRLEECAAGYPRVLMIGDSMGATGALLFSRLATAVLAFCPQVCRGQRGEEEVRPLEGAKGKYGLVQGVKVRSVRARGNGVCPQHRACCAAQYVLGTYLRPYPPASCGPGAHLLCCSSHAAGFSLWAPGMAGGCMASSGPGLPRGC
jgi:hypothetical protein